MPSSRHTGRPNSFPLRSHSAVSTAEIAQDTRPGRPLLRIARTIACQRAGTSSALCPVTEPASAPVISAAQAPSA